MISDGYSKTITSKAIKTSHKVSLFKKPKFSSENFETLKQKKKKHIKMK